MKTENVNAVVRKIPLFMFLLLALPSFCWAWQGKVVAVSEGDTITIMHEGKREVIKLYGVCAPGKGQDFGQKARQFTYDQMFGRIVDVTPVAQERFGWAAGIVSLDGHALNRELVKSGLAWVYRQYCSRTECKDWYQAQVQAQDAQIGLWSVPGPVPPWEFHSQNEKSSSNKRSKDKPKETVAKGQIGPLHGNIVNHVFHVPGCVDYNCQNCIAVFKTRERAIRAGYTACEICKP